MILIGVGILLLAIVIGIIVYWKKEDIWKIYQVNRDDENEEIWLFGYSYSTLF